MRVENARLGVETTTRRDHTARSATKHRSSLSTDQRLSARPDRNTLEEAQQGGPSSGGSSVSSVPPRRTGRIPCSRLAGGLLRFAFANHRTERWTDGHLRLSTATSTRKNLRARKIARDGSRRRGISGGPDRIYSFAARPCAASCRLAAYCSGQS